MTISDKREGKEKGRGKNERVVMENFFFFKLLLTNLIIFDPMIILQRINF